MSLWNKPVAEITFEDIEAFCQTKQPEGARLDYKGIAFPNDLGKSIAAFANTLGGLIILGVDADQTTNQPIWPPVTGMPMEAGLSERVIQIAQEAIYPPVRVEVSQVVENRALPNCAIVVIRINESREAPHAVEKNRHVYVYERTKDRNHPYGLADIGRIEYLLDRRSHVVDEREATLKENLRRTERAVRRSICPKRWMCISPAYPREDIHERSYCAMLHQLWALNLWPGAHWHFQKIEGGSFGIGRWQSEDGQLVSVCSSSVLSNGTLFCSTYASEALAENKSFFRAKGIENAISLMMDLRRIREMGQAFAEMCKRYYGDPKARPVGDVVATIGVGNASGLVMYDWETRRKSDAEFLEDDFRTELFIPLPELLQAGSTAFGGMYGDVQFAFNADAIAIS